MEQNNPVPFMEKLNKHGLPWHIIEMSPEAQK
jgi:saccharopine dehydrogenase-like NADP-dependent oxidoreductase